MKSLISLFALIGLMTAATAHAEEPSIVGTWRMSETANNFAVEVTQIITPTSITMIATCAYPASLPLYRTTTTLKLKARLISNNSMWTSAGHATTHSGSLKCPLDSEGGIGYFQATETTLIGTDKDGNPRRDSEGNVPVSTRVR